ACPASVEADEEPGRSVRVARRVKVGLDVGALDRSGGAGIARYTAELLAALPAAAPGLEVVALSNVPRSGTTGPRSASRELWMHALLPRWLGRSDLDLAHFPDHDAPLRSR